MPVKVVVPGEAETPRIEAEKWPMWRACKRAGLRRIGSHVGRHSFASHLVMRGVPLKGKRLRCPCAPARVAPRSRRLGWIARTGASGTHPPSRRRREGPAAITENAEKPGRYRRVKR